MLYPVFFLLSIIPANIIANTIVNTIIFVLLISQLLVEWEQGKDYIIIHNIKPNRKRPRDGTGRLTDLEKKCVKKLLDLKYIAQDIQYIVNQGRETTINSRCMIRS